MKTIAALFLALLAYFAWRFVVMGDALALVVPDSGKRPSAVVASVVPDERIVLAVNNPDKEQSICEITLPRATAARLRLAPPAGFAEEPLPLGDHAGDPEMVEFVRTFNRENVRWVGHRLLAEQAVSEIAIPAGSTEAISGTLQVQYRRKIGLGGSISHFDVQLDAGQGMFTGGEPAPAPPAPARSASP
ncbi:hypothetical protein [Luteimonas granuli]|uniref:Uncharacterized protein n=1 Tax=Luteimonas granuli TaxID=1176533 RepID=A0A518N4Q7_9GAMM|nr:hypothetical protein [Luteimonas granuli]QDW66900.1 hypothetical protein FPZ22_08365 [Luteimonas granuli]